LASKKQNTKQQEQKTQGTKEYIQYGYCTERFKTGKTKPYDLGMNTS
jgi:hypothetical protein